MGQSALREVTAPLNLSTGVLGVLGAAINARVNGQRLNPALEPHVDAVLDALGARSLFEGLSPAELDALLAEIRLTMLQGRRLLYEAPLKTGWDLSDPDVLRATGDTSSGFATVLQQVIVPRLAGLAERLGSDGVFLDIGVGVAGLAIAMARLWPALRVVGIDPAAPSLAIARDRVATAGLGSRIELRNAVAEDLSDENAFDLAWIPSPFIPEQAIAAMVAKVLRGLRPGGWLLFAALNPGTEPLASAYARFRTVLWGGALTTPGEVDELLRRKGYVDIQGLPSPPSSPIAIVAGRRPADPLTTGSNRLVRCLVSQGLRAVRAQPTHPQNGHLTVGS